MLIEIGEPKFTLTKHNKEVIKILVYYFCNVEHPSINLRKGIYFRGPVGTGKTTLMRAFSTWCPYSIFRMANCRYIQKQAVKNGFDALNKYSEQSYFFKHGNYHHSNGYIIYCFDDFGAENISKFYGNEINVMEELMQDRYDQFKLSGMKTHVTSNLKDGNLMEELYGPRVRDRIREMFNFIDIDEPTHRK